MTHDDTTQQQRTPAALSQLDSASFNWMEAVGGMRGICETSIPVTIYILTFVITSNIRWSLIGALIPAVIFVLWRLVKREKAGQAIVGGFVGVGLSVLWTARTGRGEDFFAWGMVTAGIYAVVLIASLMLRRPLIGLGLQFFMQLPATWWKDAAFESLRARSFAATWMWAAVFVLRLTVQYPLWHAGWVAQLGIAKIVLGLPLFALASWATWLLLKPAVENR